MTTELLRRWQCDNCGRIENRDHRCNPGVLEHVPDGWIQLSAEFGLLCDVCKGVALTALKTREKVEKR